nr:uncharacterized protein LOC110131675 isoform X2 [Odocoileus virginianus texanus]
MGFTRGEAKEGLASRGSRAYGDPQELDAVEDSPNKSHSLSGSAGERKEAPPLLRRDRRPPCQLLSLTTSTSAPSLQAPGVPRPTSRSKSVSFNTPRMDQVRGLSHQSRDLRAALTPEALC